MILAGHGIWLAARQLNMAEVPTLVLDGLTDTEKNLYLIADNQIALNSTWDQDLLHRAIEELERSPRLIETPATIPANSNRKTVGPSCM